MKRKRYQQFMPLDAYAWHTVPQERLSVNGRIETDNGRPDGLTDDHKNASVIYCRQCILKRYEAQCQQSQTNRIIIAIAYREMTSYFWRYSRSSRYWKVGGCLAPHFGREFPNLVYLRTSGVSVSVFHVGIGIRYFAIIYNFWRNTATAMSVGSFHVHVSLWITLQATPLISCEPRNAGVTCQVLCQVSTCPIIIIDN